MHGTAIGESTSCAMRLPIGGRVNGILHAGKIMEIHRQAESTLLQNGYSMIFHRFSMIFYLFSRFLS
jgi:hypothetical protein